MPMHNKHNLYPGVNAHLNSLLQSEPGGWSSFHSKHISHLDDALTPVLPQGYFTRTETGLQIREFDAGTGREERIRTTPDITLYRARAEGDKTPLTTAHPAGALSLALLDTLPDEEALMGLVIYQTGEGGVFGKPVTRVEVLSPSNKFGGSHHERYMGKRYASLSSGLCLVEIDYLHHTPPVIRGLANAYFPYHIIVSDPRPTFESGRVDVYGIGVLDALPPIRIPLLGDDVVLLDLGAVYNHTFASSSFFTLVVDYAQDIPAFERYHAADRERLATFLQGIRQQPADDEEA